MKFEDELILSLVEEVRAEQHIPPSIKDEQFIDYIKEGIYDINENVGELIDYSKDLSARSLLKNYVLYANYKRLAEFKEIYSKDYVSLQIKYNRDSVIQ